MALIATALISGLHTVIWYLPAVAVPTLLIVWRSLMWRSDEHGTVHWYPPGLMLSWLTGTALGVLAFVAVLAEMFTGGLQATIEQEIRAWAGLSVLEDTAADRRSLLDDHLDTWVHRMAVVLPGTVGKSWLQAAVLTGVIAQGLLMWLNRALRPPMRFSELALPRWMGYGLGGSVLLYFAPGLPGFVGANATLILSLPFAILGLALIHTLVAGRKWRIPALVVTYACISLFSLPWLLVAFLGVVEHLADLRRRLTQPAPMARCPA